MNTLHLVQRPKPVATIAALAARPDDAVVIMGAAAAALAAPDADLAHLATAAARLFVLAAPRPAGLPADVVSIDYDGLVDLTATSARSVSWP